MTSLFQACVPSVVSPGDNVDNDCDGEFDEDDCTPEDFGMTKNFNIEDLLYKDII